MQTVYAASMLYGYALISCFGEYFLLPIKFHAFAAGMNL